MLDDTEVERALVISDLARVIGQVRPQRVMIQSPERFGRPPGRPAETFTVLQTG